MGQHFWSTLLGEKVDTAFGPFGEAPGLRLPAAGKLHSDRGRREEQALPVASLDSARLGETRDKRDKGPFEVPQDRPLGWTIITFAG